MNLWDILTAKDTQHIFFLACQKKSFFSCDVFCEMGYLPSKIDKFNSLFLSKCSAHIFSYIFSSARPPKMNLEEDTSVQIGGFEQSSLCGLYLCKKMLIFTNKKGKMRNQSTNYLLTRGTHKLGVQLMKRIRKQIFLTKKTTHWNVRYWAMTFLKKALFDVKQMS